MNVPAETTIAALREAFAQWGQPARIRVDNGHPWGSIGDLPTELALWLMGLGIELVRNPPRRPQANGVVERSQEIAQRWAEPLGCDSAAAVQQQVDAMDQHQRAGFPDAAQSRLSMFPALAHSGRSYAASEEAASWLAARVGAALAGYAAARRVNARGLVSVYGRSHYVGRRFAGRDVYVRLDPEAGQWCVE
jgi:hypothetical protein